MKTQLKLLFLVNVDWFFISHRLPIAIEAQKQGYDIHVACAITDRLEFLTQYGFTIHPLTLQRSKMGARDTFKLFIHFYQLFKSIEPDLVHLVTIKPVILGGIAARICKVPSVIAAISGLGYVYISVGYLATVRKVFVRALYRLSLNHPNIKVIFQNSADHQDILAASCIPLSSVEIIPGSGVNIDEFNNQPPNTAHPPTILMASRILRDKGVQEFIDAATLARDSGLACHFVLAGMIDNDNPAGITLERVESWVKMGIIEYAGHQNNIANLLSESEIIVLPSYREGMPKVLLEAAAASRAVITTDVPGCRDAIIPNISGLLVPPKDSMALFTAISLLVKDRAKSASMGRAGRKLAEEKFDIKGVVSRHLKIYAQLKAQITE